MDRSDRARQRYTGVREEGTAAETTTGLAGFVNYPSTGRHGKALDYVPWDVPASRPPLAPWLERHSPRPGTPAAFHPLPSKWCTISRDGTVDIRHM